MTRAVKLTYFKDTGKYYSDAELEISDTVPFWDVLVDIRVRIAAGHLPGLIDGARFHVLVDDPAAYNVPQLILNEMGE